MEQEEKIDITNKLQSLQKERKSFSSLLTQCLKKLFKSDGLLSS